MTHTTHQWSTCHIGLSLLINIAAHFLIVSPAYYSPSQRPAGWGPSASSLYPSRRTLSLPVKRQRNMRASPADGTNCIFELLSMCAITALFSRLLHSRRTSYAVLNLLHSLVTAQTAYEVLSMLVAMVIFRSNEELRYHNIPIRQFFRLCRNEGPVWSDD